MGEKPSNRMKELYELNMGLTKKKLKRSLSDDQLIIQVINNIEDLDKVCNLLSKRLRDWYELYFPEFSRSIGDHEKFSELIIKKSREELLKEIKFKETIGSDFKKEDLDAVLGLARQLNDLYAFRKKQTAYLESLMKRCCPNVLAITGVLIGSKLIAIASGLKRLSLFPASTVQLLGAEKALFRHLKNKKARSPKYGVILNHPLVQSAKKVNRGKAARMLADKISIAAKIDYFKGEFMGDKLKKALESNLNNLK